MIVFYLFFSMISPIPAPLKSDGSSVSAPPENLLRDLSWLEFNARVLHEGRDEKVPLAERLKFLSITSSNLDEFFKVRVPKAVQRTHSENERESRQVYGLLKGISRRAHELVESQSDGIVKVLEELKKHGIFIREYAQLNVKHRKHLRSHFEKTIFPMLTPLAVEEIYPMPLLPALQLHVALRLEVPARIEQFKRSNLSEVTEHPEISYEQRLAVVPVPTQLSRWVKVQETPRKINFILLEQLIIANADLLFPGCKILSSSIFRITRDEDVSITTESEEDYAQVVAAAVSARKRREIVRLEIEKDADPKICEKLCSLLKLKESEVYRVSGLLDVTVFDSLPAGERLQKERYEDWPPVDSEDLIGVEDFYERIAQEDVFLFLPYEKFTPVTTLMEQAARDPDVLAIKQTLYRTSGDSPIVKALVKAAENGKEVTVLVELRARFDESRNLLWTNKLEDAGCHVIYGISGLKTHSKALLIIRREHGRIVRYAHLSTGNYNDKTAKLYSDCAVMTCNSEITADVAAFFNILTGYSEPVGWQRLTIEPVLLKRRFIELIEREIEMSTPEQPGRIRAKMNALQDPEVIEALYRASREGVKISLNVRGICCLRPGIPGISENIRVCSIVDRFLEHARIYEFHNGGSPEFFLSSADWMTRNLEYRFEILCPILSPAIQTKLCHFLDVYFADNQKSYTLYSDGTWVKREPRPDEAPVRAQETFYREAVEAATQPSHPPVKYIPLTREKD